MIGENNNIEHIRTIYGKFNKNVLTDLNTEEIIKCLTYGIIKDRIEDEIGMYNLKWNDMAKCYVIFQYVLMDSIE